jgi:hypothetical protein
MRGKMSVPGKVQQRVMFPSSAKRPAILLIAASVAVAICLAAFSLPVSAHEPINIEKWLDLAVALDIGEGPSPYGATGRDAPSQIRTHSPLAHPALY